MIEDCVVIVYLRNNISPYKNMCTHICKYVCVEIDVYAHTHIHITHIDISFLAGISNLCGSELRSRSV